MKRMLLAGSFLACIPAANWMIGNIGTVCVPNGPCLIPVAPGVMAPSGVLLIGAALALRDALHEAAGRRVVLWCVAGGAALSLATASPALAIASAVAFGVSEISDFAVYNRIRRHSGWCAVMVSGFVGAVVDSLLFSWLAFGAVKWAPGLIIAKCYASVAYAGWRYFRRAAVETGNAT